MQKDKKLLDRAHDSWCSLAWFRSQRRRAKDFTFGRQWGDTVRLPTGRVITEERRLLESGRVPVSNNLIRQLVKSIVGRRRYLQKDHDNPFEEIDARTFEEFLISGFAVQRLENQAINVSPRKMFFERFEQSDAGDCRFIGMLHDMAPGVVLNLFGKDNRRRAEILEIFSRSESRDVSTPLMPSETDFFASDSRGSWRVIEVWSRDSLPVIKCHDPELGEYAEAPVSAETERRLNALNAKRLKKGKKEVTWRVDVDERWTVTWLSPCGDVLMSRRGKGGEEPPFVMMLYPMLDGEVHSFVDDLIEQQKYVNRLIMMLDDVMRASAKGVVMFPVDQLPEGMTWRDVRQLWSEPGAILPFRRTSKTVMPYQMQTGGTSQGASELLKIQLDMFDEISGSTSGTRGGQSHAAGAEMLRQEFEQATVAIYDLMQSFDSFIARRDSQLKLKK